MTATMSVERWREAQTAEAEFWSSIHRRYGLDSSAPPHMVGCNRPSDRGAATAYTLKIDGARLLHSDTVR
jgi:hypothetical protein